MYAPTVGSIEVAISGSKSNSSSFGSSYLKARVPDLNRAQMKFNIAPPIIIFELFSSVASSMFDHYTDN